MSASPASRRRKGFRFAHLILMLVLLAGLIGAAMPWIRRQGPAARQAEALNNLRQLGTALFEFDREYGTFPDDDTAVDVRENTGSPLIFSGTYSNDYFRQLMACGLTNEEVYWCKTSFSPKRPDSQIDAPTHSRSEARALAAGEVGFSYVRGYSSSGIPGWVVVAAASDKARADWTFDPNTFGGKALVLKLDGSVAALTIDPATKFVLTGGAGRYIQTIGARVPWGYDPVMVAPLPAIPPR
ncbi:hypothetical protein OJ996_07575 [Luteolibacter sp. GHJ8]|uniref:DUF1559 domain-containing protein n=1 Tax=Luteolibacter rhizosphaerae TaxID=2989719 RepID=A0ABT3G183_9BACT|nr:hypothetical protein [Luteolibacter rhizosphaerae]MCW1913427.1 hypothetical protein [Luteolibacter rhizosphaerae]